MSVARFAFAGIACLAAVTVLSAPAMVAAVASAKAHVPSPPATGDNEPCFVGTPKCADIGAPPKACLVGGTNASSCPTDAKAIAVGR